MFHGTALGVRTDCDVRHLKWRGKGGGVSICKLGFDLVCTQFEFKCELKIKGNVRPQNTHETLLEAK